MQQITRLPFLLATALLLGTIHPLTAQPQKNVEVFAGYSLVNFKPGRDLDRTNHQGFAASFTSYQIFPRWGLTAEFDTNSEQNSYLFGGTYRSFRRKHFALTGRILAGATRWQPTPEQTAFAFGFGQAIDIKYNESLSLRLQPDLRFVRLKAANGTSRLSLVRPFSIGLVYQFGKR
jgi:hypothetical protein